MVRLWCDRRYGQRAPQAKLYAPGILPRSLITGRCAGRKCCAIGAREVADKACRGVFRMMGDRENAREGTELMADDRQRRGPARRPAATNTVLFVDDEPAILEGIGVALR